MTGLDTNILVRYFAQDDPVQSAAAVRFMQRELSNQQPGFVSLVTLAKLTWVLRSNFKASRDEVISVVESLLAAPSIRVQEQNAVWLALDYCESPGVGFHDALISAVGRQHGCDRTFTFDEKATRIPGMKLLITPS